MLENKTNLNSKDKALLEIKNEVLKCRQCPLFLEREKNNFFPVIGEGNHNAKIMFVGEAPGLNEARTGRPFCGRAGQILDELLNSINLKREDVYIANLLKDRPPKNRDPLPSEIASCAPFLERQIQIINPKVICPLGRYSMRFLMEKFGLKSQIDSISKIHGHVFRNKSLFQDITIIPFYHPAVATYHPSMIKVLREDFKVLKEFL